MISLCRSLLFVLVKLLVFVIHISCSQVTSNLSNRVVTSVFSCTLHGQPGQGYYMQVFIGDPHQLINVLIDTGSSNFAIAAAPHQNLDLFYNVSRSSTLKKLDRDIHVPYTEGSWKGFIGTDVISIAGQIGIRANIAFITESNEFFISGSNWQGILGLAYSAIAKPDSSVEPFFDSLVNALNVDDIFAIQLCGSTNSSDTTDHSVYGILTLGSIDPSHYVDQLFYVPLRQEWYYEIVITNMSVGEKPLGLECTEFNNDKAIVDSGTTDLRLPTAVYNAVLAMLRKNTNDRSVTSGFWEGTDVLCSNKSQYLWHAFPMLTLSLAASSSSYIKLIVAPSQYIRGITKSEEKLGGIKIAKNQRCYKLAISKSETGTVLGAILMEGFYVVFDRRNKSIGFARTSCKNGVYDEKVSSRVEGPYNSLEDTSRCVYVPLQSLQSKDIAVSIILCMLVACLLGLVLWIVQQRVKRSRHSSPANSGDDVGNLLTERD